MLARKAAKYNIGERRCGPRDNGPAAALMAASASAENSNEDIWEVYDFLRAEIATVQMA